MFDANALLDLYGLEPATRDALFDFLGSIRDRLWIPHQVAYEYHRNRVKVINQQIGKYKGAIGRLERLGPDLADHVSDAKRDLESGSPESVRAVIAKLEPKFAEMVAEISGITQRLTASTLEVLGELRQARDRQLQLIDNDSILDRLTEIIGTNIGEQYDEKRTSEIFKTGSARYAADPKVPPGYKDAGNKKGNDIYGDLFVWFQMIDKAKLEKRPMLMINSEQKEDWIEKVGERRRPRHELVQEMYERAEVPFYVYTLTQFMESARLFLGATFSPEEISDVRRFEQEVLELKLVPSAPRAPRFDVDDAAVIEAIEEYLTENMPVELDSLSSSTTIDYVSDLEILSTTVDRNGVLISGKGSVEVNLWYGGSRDGVASHGSYPFVFEALFTYELDLDDMISLEVDVSEFYEDGD